MSHSVFNSNLSESGHKLWSRADPLDPGVAEQITKEAIGDFAEQLLLFDKVCMKLDNRGLALLLLIKEIGLDRVEQLVGSGVLSLVLWTPVIVALHANADGTKDLRPGTPPVIGGAFSGDSGDPEKTIQAMLQNVTGIDRKRRRSFTRKACDHLEIPRWLVADDVARATIEAYEQNHFQTLGLPFIKPSDELSPDERHTLQTLGTEALEASVIAQQHLKGYGHATSFHLTQEAVQRAEGALHVTQNTSKILSIENVPDPKSLFVSGQIPFERVLELRRLKEVKAYRKWINEVSDDADATEIGSVFLDAIEDKTNSLRTPIGKAVRATSVFVAGTALSAVLGPAQALLANIGITAFDTYLIDAMAQGYNPRLFVNRLRNELPVSKP